MPAKNYRVVSTAVPAGVARALKDLARRRGLTVNRLLAGEVHRLLRENVAELVDAGDDRLEREADSERGRA